MSYRQLEAVLCGVIRDYGLEHVLSMDLTQVGVSSEVIQKWWIRHKREDEAREKEQRELDAKKAVIDQLTPEQRQALGL